MRYGQGVALLAAAGFGAFSVALRWGRLSEMLPVSLLGGMFSALVAAAVLALQGVPLAPSAWDIGVSTGIGALILALGMLCYTLGSRVIPAAELTLLSLIEVLPAPLWVFVFLGETASAATFAGGGVLLAAVALNAVIGARAQTAQGLAKAPGPVNE